MKILPVADVGSSSAAPPLDLASRLTENAEIVSECLSVLQQLVPQLSAEERVLVATQHPYATPVWLDSLAALSRGQLSDDLLLIVDLERELANCQVLASTRNRQLAEQQSSRGEAGQGHGACLAAADESAAAPVRAAHPAEDGEQSEEELVEQQQQQQQQQQREQREQQQRQQQQLDQQQQQLDQQQQQMQQREHQQRQQQQREQQQQQQQQREQQEKQKLLQQQREQMQQMQLLQQQREQREQREQQQQHREQQHREQQQQLLLQQQQRLMLQQQQQAEEEEEEEAAAAAAAAVEADLEELKELKQRRASYEELGEGSCGEDDDDIDEERRKRRSEGKFDSISEEIAALNAGIISEPSTVDAVDERVECKFCARKFAPERLEKHTVICKETKKNAAYRSAVKK